MIEGAKLVQLGSYLSGLLNWEELEEEEKTGSVLQMGALCSHVIPMPKVVKNFSREKLCKELIPRKIVYIFLHFILHFLYITFT